MSGKLDKKLNHFKTLIFDEIHQKNKETTSKNDLIEQTQIEQKRKELLKEADKFYKMRMEQTENAMHQVVSEAEVASVNQALALKRNILDETVVAIGEKTIVFAETKAYKMLMQSRMSQLKEEILSVSSLEMSVREKDGDWLKEQLRILGYHGELSVKKLPKKDIAGMIITFLDQHIRYNLTLKNMIDEKIDHIGAKLYELLEEMEG